MIDIAGKKKKVAELIYTVEELSTKARIPVVPAFRKIYERTGIKELKDIAERISKGEEPRIEIYREYIDKGAYIILREGEKRGIPAGSLLGKYVSYMNTYNEMKNLFRTTLIFQVIYFSVLAIAGYFLLGKIGGSLIGTKQVSDPSFYYTVKNLYIPVNLTIIAGLLFVALFPDRVPKVREGFKEMESARVLGLTYLLYRAGSSIKDITIFLAEDKSVGKYFEKARSFGIEGFIEGVEELLRPEEVAVLELSQKSAQFLEGLERLTEYKMKVAQERLKGVAKQVQTFSIILGVIPILFVIIGNGYLINDVFQNVMQKMRRY